MKKTVRLLKDSTEASGLSGRKAPVQYIQKFDQDLDITQQRMLKVSARLIDLCE